MCLARRGVRAAFIRTNPQPPRRQKTAYRPEIRIRNRHVIATPDRNVIETHRRNVIDTPDRNVIANPDWGEAIQAPLASERRPPQPVLPQTAPAT
jgi:hypothetical protein